MMTNEDLNELHLRGLCPANCAICRFLQNAHDEAYSAARRRGMTCDVITGLCHWADVIELEREADGRWLASAPEYPGVMAYGTTEAEAMAEVRLLIAAEQTGSQGTETPRGGER